MKEEVSSCWQAKRWNTTAMIKIFFIGKDKSIKKKDGTFVEGLPKIKTMKIRIKDNTLRYRLSQSEVTQLSEKGKVSSHICFGPHPGQHLNYTIVKYDGEVILAHYNNHEITTQIPTSMIQKWASTDQVGMEAQMFVCKDDTLYILIEKDFKCLSDRPNEDESDLYPHPKEGEHQC